MKSRLFAASVALAVLTPSVAFADDGCQRDSSGRVIGTVAGAGVGGLAGHVIAGRGDKTEGAIIGAVVGAVIGNQVSKNSGDCRTASGYYDKDGRWHSTGVSYNDARGYYDRDGKWVDGQPNGYYDSNGRWVSVSNSGYVDRDGYWVPASANGYYDRNGNWVGGSANGYYDSRGRWVAGPVQGRYDSKGRWIAGSSSSNSNTMEQPGYYDNNGRWREGRAYGYYDSRGRWVSVQQDGYANNGGYYDSQYDLGQMPNDIPTRISWLREYVRNGEDARRIKRTDASYARSELTAIEKQNRSFNRDGRFTQKEQRTIDQRLDKLTTRLDKNWRQALAY